MLKTINKSFKEKFEPGIAPYEERIKALEFLHKRGLKTWVSMEPYPTSNLSKQKLPEILKRIGFVDKIIFGKLNYNVRVTEFEDNKNFYDERADEVINFCESRGIEYHIKYGMAKRDNEKTEKIFRKVGLPMLAGKPLIFFNIHKANSGSTALNSRSSNLRTIEPSQAMLSYSV